MSKFRLTIISALLLIIAAPSFPYTGFHHSVWIFLVPFLLVLSEVNSLKSALKIGLLMGWLVSLGVFFWVATGIHQYLNLNWISSIILYVFALSVCHPQYFLFAGVMFFIKAYNSVHW
jgi:apolipoprotein N-acyltransferase